MHTKIQSDLLERLAQTKLNGTQYAAILAIIRLTVGIGRDEYELSLSVISEFIDVNRKQLQRELTKLIKRQIVIAKDTDFLSPRLLKVNPNLSEWTD